MSGSWTYTTKDGKPVTFKGEQDPAPMPDDWTRQGDLKEQFERFLDSKADDEYVCECNECGCKAWHE